MGLYFLTSQVMIFLVSWRHPAHLTIMLGVLSFEIFLGDLFVLFAEVHPQYNSCVLRYFAQ